MSYSEVTILMTEQSTSSTLSSQIAAYEEMRNVLEADYFGRWVILHGGSLVDSYETFEGAAEDAVARFGRGPYLIRQVGAPPAHLPASVLYRPSNAND